MGFADGALQRPPLMRLERIDRVFDAGAVIALRAVNLTIANGERLAILGKSGSGKSTLLHIMGGCDSPTSGSVSWRGEKVNDQRRWRQLRGSEIGIVFQEFHLLPSLSARENVEMALIGRGIGWSDRVRRSRELLDRVGLGGRMDHLPHALSGGERQRVAIARSIANNPSLLLADEPTGNLDSANAASVEDLLFEIQRANDAALAIVTHDETLAARCVRRIRIKDGEVREDLNPGAEPRPQVAGAAP